MKRLAESGKDMGRSADVALFWAYGDIFFQFIRYFIHKTLVSCPTRLSYFKIPRTEKYGMRCAIVGEE